MNTSPSAFSIPLARYRFEWEVETPLRLPEYAGSALRGVFGSALRGVVCLTGQTECPGCGLWRTCPYPLIFETPPPLVAEGEKFMGVTPNPYVIEPPPWGAREYRPGETLVFHMVLVGKALAQLALIFLAWQRALARGVGPGNGTARLQRVVLMEAYSETVIFTREIGVIRDHESTVSVPPWPGEHALPVAMLTPTRIQRDGSPLGPERLTPRDLLVALMRRVSQMVEIHGAEVMRANYAELARQASLIDARGRLAWRDWTRRSARQQQTMSLGGVVGVWTFTGPLELFWSYLYLGQWLHLGKNATFGLGHYRLGIGTGSANG
ncbi:MAG: CRISPR system precrRNA processing endoribonuclease RAMP protein Cas6 [Magnetococcales bacterium]|nr:CRISPR system precrRNA processing endoribonuclease RAMP protein Cas6 [Magnetococcales bacterium]